MEKLLIIFLVVVVIITIIFNIIMTYSEIINLNKKVENEVEAIKSLLKRKIQLIDEFNKYIKVDFDILEKAFELRDEIEITHDIEDLSRYAFIIKSLINYIRQSVEMNGRENDFEIRKILLEIDSIDKKLKEHILNLNEYIAEYNEVLKTRTGGIIRLLSDFNFEKNFVEF